MSSSLAPSWRKPSKSLLAALLSISIFTGLLYTGATLHNTAYEPAVIHQAVEAAQHAASGVQHEIIPNEAFDHRPNVTTLTDDGDDEYCNKFPDPGNIAIIIKTGASELYAKLPTTLATVLKCVREPLIFSDLEHRLGEYHVHNVLANFTPSAMNGNKDFDIYRKQQQYIAEGREADLPGLSSVPIPSDDWRTQGKSAAWGLDKYKFLHMVEQSWEFAPDRDWYFFMEADTYISWSNLLKWLATLDSRKKLYYGKATRIWEYKKTELYFGHGGSGFLLSGAVVKEFAIGHRGLATRWDERVHKMWYGDYVLAAALYEELHVRLTDASPSLTSDDTSALTFSPENFCKPVLTLHHMSSPHLNDLFQFERAFNGSELLYRDIYHGSFSKGMPPMRENWDNLSPEVEIPLDFISDKSGSKPDEDPHYSYESCEKACLSNGACLQFMFVDSIANEKEDQGVNGECHIMRGIKLGQDHQPEIDGKGEGAQKRWKSGWLRDRIARWIEEHQGCSIDNISWPQ